MRRCNEVHGQKSLMVQLQKEGEEEEAAAAAAAIVRARRAQDGAAGWSMGCIDLFRGKLFSTDRRPACIASAARAIEKNQRACMRPVSDIMQMQEELSWSRDEQILDQQLYKGRHDAAQAERAAPRPPMHGQAVY